MEWLRKEDKREETLYGKKVVFKSLTYGEARKANADAMTIDFKTGKVSIDAQKLALTRLILSIESWEFTDEKGEVLPINVNTFDNVLSEGFIDQLMALSEVKAEDKEKKNQ